MKTKLLSLCLMVSMVYANAQTYFTENFDDITTLTAWTFTNQSSPVGTSGWFQGNTTVLMLKRELQLVILVQILAILQVRTRLAIG